MVRRRATLAWLALALAAPPAAADRMPVYRTSGGEEVRISGFPEVAQGYAEFFAGLPHGPELSSLRVLIVAPEDASARCGAGMSACYVPRESLIVAPGPELDGPLLAHEYGHHVAAHRRGPTFSSLLMGPPHWASAARVCGRLRDASIGMDWANEPAEAWADVYARLTYPDLPWRLSPLLRPSEPAFAAALADVLTPWRAPRTVRFRGRFGDGGTGVRRFRVPLRLDGEIEVALQAERAARFDLRGAVGRGRTPVSRDRALRFTACRSGRERATVTVLRRSGSGLFTLKVRYPG